MLSFRTLLEFIVILSVLEQTARAAVSCPSGDTAGVIKDGQTCSALVTSDNSECYNTTTETACCASCNTASSGNPASCLYGDSASCLAILCSSYIGVALDNCCGTCGSSVSTATPSTAAPTTATPTTATPTTATPTTASPTMAAPTTAGSGSGGSSGSSSSGNNNAGVIAGAVIGSMASAGFLAGGAFLLVRWFNKKNKVDGESTENLPEKVDSDHKPADIESDLPIKPYNNPAVFIAQTVPPSHTGEPDNQNINNNSSKKDITEKSEQTNNNTNDENKGLNKGDKTEESNKTSNNDSSTETHIDTEIRRQSLPPLQGTKPTTTTTEPLPPIAYRK